MRAKIVEAYWSRLYLKTMFGRFDRDEWSRKPSAPDIGHNMPLLRQQGWTPEHYMILDLSQSCGGTLSRQGGLTKADIAKASAQF